MLCRRSISACVQCKSLRVWWCGGALVPMQRTSLYLVNMVMPGVAAFTFKILTYLWSIFKNVLNIWCVFYVVLWIWYIKVYEMCKSFYSDFCRFYFLNLNTVSSRLTGSAQIHHEGHDSSAANWPVAFLCHPHVRHYWTGVLHGQIPHDLLRQSHR